MIDRVEFDKILKRVNSLEGNIEHVAHTLGCDVNNPNNWPFIVNKLSKTNLAKLAKCKRKYHPLLKDLALRELTDRAIMLELSSN